MKTSIAFITLFFVAACDPSTEEDGCTADCVFGEASITVGGPSETWLINVFSVPTEAESPSGSATFSLSAGGAAGALRMVTDRSEPTPLHPAWQDRLAFESARHAAIDALAVDLRAHRRTLDRAVPRQASCGDCGTAAMCWEGACVSSLNVTFAGGTSVACSLADVVTTGPVDINVVVDNAAGIADVDAIDAVTSFASTLAAELDLLGQAGHTGAIDRDGDGRLTVVFTDRTTSVLTDQVVGFFLLEDFLPAGTAGASGNEADLLWVRPPDPAKPDLAVATMAHEYVHLVSYATRVHARGSNALRETLWLDEGISHLMEDLSGWGTSNVDAVDQALEQWASAGFGTSVDSVPQRGQAYLLLRHLVDKAGATNAGSTATRTAARTLVSGLISGTQRGWEHPELSGAGAAGVQRMLLALYATGNPNTLLSSAHAHDYLPTATNATTGRLTGIDPYAQGIEDAHGIAIDFDGPEIEAQLADLATPVESEVQLTGSIYYELTGAAAGTINLVARGDPGLHLFVERVQ